VITRAVGNREYVEVDTRLIALDKGDRFLLCSDGLHGYLREGDVVPIVKSGGEEAVKKFVALANERGGKDNITAVVVEVD
jgi:protein phosphatase